MEALDTTYQVNYYLYDYLSNGGFSWIPDELREQYDAYYPFVEEQYLTIDESLREELLQLATQGGVTGKGVELIQSIAAYIQTAADYNLGYSPFPEGCDMILHFLKDGGEGVCQHYAAAATMTYRAFGIPARYTVGYKKYALAHEKTAVTAMDAHAWVEVYIHNFGWVPVEVTGSANTQENEGIKVDIKVLKEHHEIKQYDGTALTHVPTADRFAVTSLDGKAYTWDVVSTTKVSNVGRAALVAQFRFYDPQTGKFVGMKRVVYGSLEVTPRKLKITTGSKQSTDTTQALYCHEYTQEGLLDGHELDMNFTESLYGLGFVQNKVERDSLKVFTDKNIDVTRNYEIELVFGTLSVVG
jgi:transglutaminase-like putative cysteine protease